MATLPSSLTTDLYGIPTNHENLCKVEVGGELYKAIDSIITAAVLAYKPMSMPPDVAGKFCRLLLLSYLTRPS